MSQAARITTITLLFLSFKSFALPGNLGAGGQLSAGATSLPHATTSLAHNPALLARALDGQTLGINGFGLPAIALELGDFKEDFVDRLDQLEEQIEIAEDENRPYAERRAAAEKVDDELSPLMQDMARAARVNLDLSMALPGLPLVSQGLGGHFAVNAEAAASLSARVLNSRTEATFDDISQTVNIDDDTAVYVRSAEIFDVAFAYSRSLGTFQLARLNGELSLGARLHLMQGKLSRQVMRVDDDGEEEEDTAFDRAGDNYDANSETANALGLDLGVGFIGKNFSMGLNLRNLVPPEFSFGDLGRDCATKPEPQRSDCEATAYYTDPDPATGYGAEAIPAREDYTLPLQAVLELSYTLGESGLSVLASHELNALEGINGGAYQWSHVGLAYSGPWWLPSLRLGYRQNLADEGMGVICLGLNLFRFLSIEAFQATEKGEFDGEEYPRSAGVSIGLTRRF